ncbi:cystathionine beta-lyase, partial [Kappamyces sp. JEL0680]
MDKETPTLPSPSLSQASLSSSLEQRRPYRPGTQCVYVDTGSVSDPYNASSMPIYQTATFKQSSATEMGEYDYSRSGNPTRSHVGKHCRLTLENHLAKLMKAERALCISSGMTVRRTMLTQALDIVLRLVQQGQEIVAGDDIYGGLCGRLISGTNRLLTFCRSQNGTTVHHVDTTNLAAVEQVLNGNTKIVLLETPTNPLIKIVDIPGIVALVRRISPLALVVVDNTMMSPYLQNPIELGADIVYHSGTKYLSGHHDLMCGIVGTLSAELGQQLYFIVNATGVGLAPFECFLLMRGIKTLAVRMERQQTSAMKIATFLENAGFKVRYPGLKSHPQYALHASMARGAGAVLSFETGDVAKSERIVEAARLWLISVSFGCVNSLI